jgi:hypothetical protein
LTDIEVEELEDPPIKQKDKLVQSEDILETS